MRNQQAGFIFLLALFTVASLATLSVASLTRRDLECMAVSAISRFIVLSSERRTTAPDKEERDALDLLLMG